MATTKPSSHSVFTVAELTRHIKTLLEQAFPLIWVAGEISNCRRPASGHYYFTLKDSSAQISAVMFKGPAARLPFRLEDGLAVVGLGRLSVYEPRGTYQIIFEHLEPKGRGALQMAFEQLKAKLSEEGLFDTKHKRSLPFLPRKVHIVTSPTGSVIHDTIQIIQRRFPNMPIAIVPTRVQGDEAEADIIRALDLVNRLPDAEVAILARGGGSLEDLQAFNAERVARAIHAARIPIVAAIGHETDYTIADFVADVRAPTPSAAAELVVPEKYRLEQQCAALTTRLVRQIQAEILYHRDLLTRTTRRLRDPGRQIQEMRLRLDDLQDRFVRAMHLRIERYRLNRHHLHGRLSRIPILSRLQIYQQKLKTLNHIILNKYNNIYFNAKTRHDVLAQRLVSLNPLMVLQRGFSITRALPSRQVVKYADAVDVNQQMEVELASGVLLCRVEGKLPHGEENI